MGGSPRISDAVEQRVVELIAEGWTYSATAREAGICRASVPHVLRRRGVFDRPRRKRVQRSRWETRGWCPECGVNVKLPCLACQVRGVERVRPPLNGQSDDLTFDLTPEEHARRAECVDSHMEKTRDNVSHQSQR